MSPIPKTARTGVLGSAAVVGLAGVAGLIVALTSPDVDPDPGVDAVTSADVVFDAVPEEDRGVDPASREEYPEQRACYIVQHPDESRIGEVILVKPAGYGWAPFERGDVEYKGVRLGLKPVPGKVNAADVDRGAVGMKNGLITSRKARHKKQAAPVEDIE